MAKAANVTKYDAGGSGDNVIPDGYIKAVEKIWMDSYTIAFTNTNTTIDLAKLQANKKITSVDVEIYTTTTQTNGTVSIGFNSDASVDTLLAASTISHNGTRTTISLPAGFISNSVAPILTVFNGVLAGFQKVLAGTQTTVAIKLNNWTATSGTIKSIVRYT